MQKQVKLPFEKFKDGNFYQVKPSDAKRMANRIFQIYDKDASKDINFRESKGILREIYKGFKPKKNLTDEDYQQLYKLLQRNGSNTVVEEDFLKITEEYFVTYTKKGSLDKQNIHPEIYELDKNIQKNKGPDIKKQKETLFNEAINRFGNDFAQYQRNVVKDLFNKHNTSHDSRLNFDDTFKIFETIYQKINPNKKGEKIDKNDVNALMKLINYNQDGLITLDEFEVFYFKALLGS